MNYSDIPENSRIQRLSQEGRLFMLCKNEMKTILKKFENRVDK